MFCWEQDEDHKPFYRRTPVVRSDALDEYAQLKPYQRCHWGDLNQWDLVPHLPPPPGFVNSDDDLGYEVTSFQPPSLSTNNAAGLGDLFMRAMEAGTACKAGESAINLLHPVFFWKNISFCAIASPFPKESTLPSLTLSAGTPSSTRTRHSTKLQSEFFGLYCI